MDLAADILSQITTYSKYARYIKELGRRETWVEICARNMNMNIKKYPQLAEEIKEVYAQFVVTKKVLPSMRSLQFAGKSIELANNRIYNCCALPVSEPEAFSETMFLLMGGTGVGYSVQNSHVSKLPPVRKPIRSRRFLVGDSIEGWADAVKVLINAYMKGKSRPIFDFSDIREKGAPLVTSGGKAPGPQPLKDCIYNLQKMLDSVDDGAQLSSLQVHDMMCHIADAVLAGGIRRAALIALFDMDDEEMLTCKYGAWWELNPQRGRANNSAVVLRHRVKEDDFGALWKKVQASGSGEPGIFFSNDRDLLTNPCAEISLRPFQFCNLTTINCSGISSQDEFNSRAKAAAFLGTLQTGYTNFHYLRDIWRRTTEKEALLGVSMTGIASGSMGSLDEAEAARIVLKENERVAALVGVAVSARTTAVKPEGTSSCVLGTSSGIHAWHDKYYIRRMRVGKNESLYHHLSIHHPELLEDDVLKPQLQAIISLPMKAPEGAILRDEPVLEQLERIKRYNINWVRTGHRKGGNTHNVSATVSVKSGDWDTVGEWMWRNREFYSGLSVLPFSDHSYVQAPFTVCTKEEYEALLSKISGVDLSEVVEVADMTDRQGEVACGGGNCELT